MSEINFDELFAPEASKSQISNAIKSIDRMLSKNKIKDPDDREYYRYQLEKLKSKLSEK